MLSDRVRKIEKARQYLVEAERFEVFDDYVLVRGDHGNYKLLRQRDSWICSCDYCRRHGWCAHTLAYEWYSGSRPHVTNN